MINAGTGDALVRRGLAELAGTTVVLVSGRKWDSSMIRGGSLGYRTRSAYAITQRGREVAKEL